MKVLFNYFLSRIVHEKGVLLLSSWEELRGFPSLGDCNTLEQFWISIYLFIPIFYFYFLAKDCQVDADKKTFHLVSKFPFSRGLEI